MPNQKYTHSVLPGVKVILWFACKKEFDCMQFFFSKSSPIFFSTQNGIVFPKVRDVWHVKEWFVPVHAVQGELPREARGLSETEEIQAVAAAWK